MEQDNPTSCEHCQKGKKYVPTKTERICLQLERDDPYFPQSLEQVIGASSKTIYSFFALNTHLRAFPQCVEDFSRNYVLLKLYPEWRPRMKEMGILGEEWKQLTEEWEELEQSYLRDKGLYERDQIPMDFFCCAEANDRIKQCVGMG